jgi:bacterioferritin-associated ferredoxin
MPEDEIDLSQIYSLMRPKNICICKAVSEAELVNAIHSGAHTLEELIFQTSASTKCGSCATMVRAIFQREMDKIQKESS